MTFVLPNGVHISEFQPSRDCEVFVYRIPRSVCEQELTSMFEKYGDIYHLRLVQRAEKRHNYAFVRFTNKIAVKVAVLRWNAYEIRMEERISVCRSIENKKLVLFNVPRHLPCQEIKKLISLYTKGLQDVHVFEPKDGKSANTGFAGKNANTGLAFLIYDTHICASVAKKTLNATNDFHNYKKPLYVEWYTPGLSWDDSEASVSYFFLNLSFLDIVIKFNLVSERALDAANGRKAIASLWILKFNYFFSLKNHPLKCIISE